jgi:hypothetical protein
MNIILTSILISLFFALVFTILLSYIFRRRAPGPAGGAIFIFLILFMFTWAIGIMIDPLGPVFYGIPWVEYLLVAFAIMLLIGALLPRSRPEEQTRIHSKLDVDEKVKRRQQGAVAFQLTFGIFFWLMIFVLFMAAIIRIMA